MFYDKKRQNPLHRSMKKNIWICCSWSEHHPRQGGKFIENINISS